MPASTPIMPIHVTAFIDWNSQLRAVQASNTLSPTERAREALRRVGHTVTRIITEEDPLGRFRLFVRLYCGWTKGFTRSDYFKAIAGLTDTFDIDLIFPSSRISVSSDIEYGDRLIDALSTRQNGGLGIHLPNTLRNQGWAQLQEKMVDTALACDLLSWVRSNPDGWSVVVSNDDDMVPPVFIAEAWLQGSHGRVFLARSQSRPSDRFLRLEGLVR